jgi:hypothetical protein
VVWQFNEAQLQNGLTLSGNGSSKHYRPRRLEPSCAGGPAQLEKWLTRADGVFARTLRSKNITGPKKVRKMNDIKPCCAIKEPNLSSAESPRRLQLSVKI